MVLNRRGLCLFCSSGTDTFQLHPYVDRCLTREDCHLVGPNLYAKDLGKVCSDLSKTVLIDDSPVAALYFPGANKLRACLRLDTAPALLRLSVCRNHSVSSVVSLSARHFSGRMLLSLCRRLRNGWREFTTPFMVFPDNFCPSRPICLPHSRSWVHTIRYRAAWFSYACPYTCVYVIASEHPAIRSAFRKGEELMRNHGAKDPRRRLFFLAVCAARTGAGIRSGGWKYFTSRRSLHFLP